MRDKDYALEILKACLQLLVGGAIAVFSVYVTNRSNRALLEPYLEATFGEPNDLGMIEISSDTLHFRMANNGPANVDDVEVFFDTFHGSPNLNSIVQDTMQGTPIFRVKQL